MCAAVRARDQRSAFPVLLAGCAPKAQNCRPLGSLSDSLFPLKSSCFDDSGCNDSGHARQTHPSSEAAAYRVASVEVPGTRPAFKDAKASDSCHDRPSAGNPGGETKRPEALASERDHGRGCEEQQEQSRLGLEARVRAGLIRASVHRYAEQGIRNHDPGKRRAQDDEAGTKEKEGARALGNRPIRGDRAQERGRAGPPLSAVRASWIRARGCAHQRNAIQGRGVRASPTQRSPSEVPTGDAASEPRGSHTTVGLVELIGDEVDAHRAAGS